MTQESTAEEKHQRCSLPPTDRNRNIPVRALDFAARFLFPVPFGRVPFLSAVTSLGKKEKWKKHAYRDQRIHVGCCNAAQFCDSVEGRPQSFIPPGEAGGYTRCPHEEEETGAFRVRVIQL